MTSRQQQRALPESTVVTGGNGRIGRLVVADLRARGCRVISLARSHGAEPRADDISIDLTDSQRLAEIVAQSGATEVLHLAAAQRGDEVEATNERIDLAVASAASGLERVVLASSAAVYGAGAADARSEDSALDGTSPYARSKQRSERIFADLVDQRRVASVLALRIFNVAGPEFPDSLVQRLIRAVAAEPVQLTEPDRFIRDYLHQDDLVALLRASLTVASPGYRVVNLGAGVAVSTRMLLNSIQPRPDSVVVAPGPMSSSWADVSEMRTLFGIQPRTMPDRGWDRSAATPVSAAGAPRTAARGEPK